jgi:iron complex transport system substrate-binding protein
MILRFKSHCTLKADVLRFKPIGNSVNDIILGMLCFRSKGYLSSLLLFVVLSALLGGCSTPSTKFPVPTANSASHSASHSASPSKDQFPRDDLGREVKLSSPAQRVVCIGPGATETIFALGAQKKLVGRDQVSDYPSATGQIPVVGDYNGPFVEKAIAVKPDLVIVQGETYDRARAENWQQKIGVPVAVLVPTSVDKLQIGIGKIRQWLGIKGHHDVRVSLWPRTGHRLGVPAFFEVERSPLWTAGNGTLISDMLRIAGLENVANVSGYKQFNVEQLLAKQPYVYIVPVPAGTRASEYPRLLQILSSHPVLGRLKCVREKRVIFIDSDWVLRPGPRLQQGLKELARRGDAMALELDPSSGAWSPPIASMADKATKNKSQMNKDKTR